MATTEKTYTVSNQSKGPYTFPFPYIKEADVKVSKNGTELDLTIEYTQATTSITLVDTPDNDDKIRIYRNTDTVGLAATFYPGSAIRSSDLNDNFTQNLYVTQEAENDAATAITDSATAITTADAAVVTANAADAIADAAVVTADAAEATADAAETTANTASTNASAAVTTANTASTNASSAVTTANTANTNASAAVTTANTASTNASAAVTTANTADTNADAAVVTANTASTNASSAVTTANTASTNASSAVTTANTASTNASAAVVTANAASASVAASAIYVITTDLSGLTTSYPINSTNHEQFVQINDTTGITLSGGTWSGDFATGSGVSFPTSFDGNSQLTLKLRVNNTTGKYDVQEYYANDPEARYGEDRKVVVENNRTIAADYIIQTTMNALSVGPVSIDSGKTLTIPANSRYVVL